jgi:quinol-cytochrome oxidoreductase complex cytochrome b subunit
VKVVLDWFNERFPSIGEMTKVHATGYPTPSNLKYTWAFGATIMFFFMLQVATGIGAAMFYKPDAHLAFDSVERFRRHVPWGWLIQYMHAICPSFIFGAIYIHIARGMYYGSYRAKREIIWFVGLFLFMTMMMESFMGYVLPWGQMSYWAGTVITELPTVIPFIGDTVVTWVRGDIILSDATLNRFYSFHIAFFPIAVVGGLIVLHIMALHDVGSNNPTGVNPLKEKKIPFYPYYVIKDWFFITFLLTIFFFIVFFYPYLFLEADNFEKANSAATPTNIRPEWYFLPFFAMLKSIPSKPVGVIVIWAAQWLFFLLPFIDRSPIKSATYRPIKKWMDWIFFINFIFLGYIGTKHPEGMILIGGQIGVLIYLGYFVLLPVVSSFEKVKPQKLVQYEEKPETIVHEEPSQGKKKFFFILMILFLIAMNIRAFTFHAPSEKMINEGRRVYHTKGKAFHSVEYLDERALMPEDARIKSFGKLPPDLSVKYKSMGEEELREFLEQFIGGPPAGSKMQANFEEDDIHKLMAFLEYSADPSVVERAKIGPWVTLFLSIFTVFLYFYYKEVWKDLHNNH